MKPYKMTLEYKQIYVASLYESRVGYQGQAENCFLSISENSVCGRLLPGAHYLPQASY